MMKVLLKLMIWFFVRVAQKIIAKNNIYIINLIINMENLHHSIKNHIVCNKCVEELSNESSSDINLKNYTKFEVGFTSIGITKSGVLDIK